MYAPTQRWYNGFRDEWDLCSKFDPLAENQDSSDEDNSSDNNSEPLPAYSDPAPAREINAVGDLMHDLANIHDDGPPPEPSPDIPVKTLDDAAYNKFGFQEEYPLPSGTTSLAWKHVHKLLGEGYGTSRQGVLSWEMQESLSTFFGYLATGARVADIPAALYDINQPASDINCLPKNINISILGGKPIYYVLVPHDVHENRFFVVLRSPAAVVEVICRIWDLDVMSMVQELLNSAYLFNCASQVVIKAT